MEVMMVMQLKLLSKMLYQMLSNKLMAL
jgi:hypothetical protein